MSGSESGKSYRFKLRDVICPDRSEILNQITLDLEVTGSITLISDGGQIPGQFAAIEVEGIATPLIVPVAKLKTLLEPDKAGEVDAALEQRLEKMGTE